jgi:hypothetical protein
MVNGLKERGEFDLFISTNRPFEGCPNPEDFIGELGDEPKASLTLPIRLKYSALIELRLGQLEKDLMLKGVKWSHPRILFLVLDPIEEILRRMSDEETE